MFLFGLILLQACVGPPDQALNWRKQWELLILTEDGGMVDARITVGNTGVLRRQGHVRANRWSSKDTPILFALDGGPGDVDISDMHDAVRVGSSLLGRYESGDNWTLRVSNEDANAIIHVDPGGPDAPLSTALEGDGQWTMTAPITHGKAHGWFTAGRRGGMFEGRAIALQHGGDGIAGPRSATFVLGEGISIGIDAHEGQRLTWARMGDMDIDMSDVAQRNEPDGAHTIDFRPAADLVVTLEPTDVGGSIATDGHLYEPERLLARLHGLNSSRTVTRTRAEVLYEGKKTSASGLLVRTE